MGAKASQCLLIAFFILAIGSDLISANASEQGPLRFSATIQRITAAIGNRIVEFRFPFVNAGATPIAIEAISVSCPCLQAVSGIGTYTPGASGCVVVSMEVSDQTPTQRGVVHITTGAEGFRSTDLTAVLDVPPLLTFAPTILQWARTPNGAAAAAEKKTLTATIAPGNDFEISAIHVVSPRFSCTSTIAEDRRTAVVSVVPVGSGKVVAGTVDVTITSRRAPKEERVLHAYLVIYGE